MPASQAFAGPGWSLKHNGTEVTEVGDLNGPQQKSEKEEVTNQSSPNFYKEWVPTLLDGGDVDFDANLVPGDASQAGLLSAMQARTLEIFTLNPPPPYSATTYGFSAYVMDWSIKGPVSKKGSLHIKLTITGPVTIS